MSDRRIAIWRGARPLIGTVVGVGIFGLPFVFAQAGYVYGWIEMIIVAALCFVTFVIFGDLLAISKGQVRFVSVVSNQLGPLGRMIAATAFFGSLWGAMLAYIIVGGQFLATIVQPLLGGEVIGYQIAFWLLSSLLMIGGPLFVRQLQSFLIPLFFVLIAGLALYAIPSFEVSYLTAVNPSNILVPFGTLIFAMSGFAAVPECREALGRNKALIRPALALAVAMVCVAYTLFTFAVVGLTGPFTSVQAVSGLRLVAGPWLSVFVSAIGLCTVVTAYMSVGSSLLNSLLYDFRGRFLSSWWLATAIPLAAFLLGARDFIGVIGTTGGLLGGLSGIVLLIAYEKARLTAQLPKRALALPQGLVALCFVLFAAMIIMTMVELA